MTSIRAAICVIYGNNFKRHYHKKKKNFTGLFIAFLTCAWNLEHFQKRDEYPIVIISEIIDAEWRIYLNF